MARILFINSVCNGSTGTICKNLYKAAERNGHICCIAYGRGQAPNEFNTIRVGNKIDFYFHVLKARLFDASGFGSKFATRQLIKEIDRFKPDVIHLHNIHGYYINVEILFDYLRKHPEIKKIWTLHDCWSFTGHCPHFEYERCKQWQTGCKKCIRTNKYPKSYIDRSAINYIKKRNLFVGISNMLLVSPSEWLSNLISVSFLKRYPIKVINNGVDTNLFKYTKSEIKEKYKIKNKKVILGVASVWDEKKGLDIFKKLSEQIGNEYKIVLIGLSNKQIKSLPDNMIGINRTEDVHELVKWYSAATVFLNPTLEDNYPTTNLEAIACGTPVITFNTGGSPESAFADADTIVYSRNIKEIINKIKKCKSTTFFQEKINTNFMENMYLKLYKQLETEI